MAELFLAVGLAWRVPLGVFRDIDEIEGRSLDALAGQFTCQLVDTLRIVDRRAEIAAVYADCGVNRSPVAEEARVFTEDLRTVNSLEKAAHSV
jgi:hypothetical protein